MFHWATVEHHWVLKFLMKLVNVEKPENYQLQHKKSKGFFVVSLRSAADASLTGLSHKLTNRITKGGIVQIKDSFLQKQNFFRIINVIGN